MTTSPRTGDALPKVDCKLVGEDGNSFAVMGRFRRAARNAKWTQAEIKSVLDDAMSGGYAHLLFTIERYCK